MRVFVDTSGYFSLLDSDEKNHETARQIWERLLKNDDILITSNYVLIETVALVQNRLGMAAVTDFYDNFIPLTEITWVDQQMHQAGVAALLTANRRKLSLVDCISFETCRQLGIRDVFTFDQHFQEQGFVMLSP